MTDDVDVPEEPAEAQPPPGISIEDDSDLDLDAVAAAAARVEAEARAAEAEARAEAESEPEPEPVVADPPVDTAVVGYCCTAEAAELLGDSHAPGDIVMGFIVGRDADTVALRIFGRSDVVPLVSATLQPERPVWVDKNAKGRCWPALQLTL